MKTFLTVAMACVCMHASAQQHNHDHPHANDHHSHHKNEIGVANSAVYFVKEETFNYGLHLHYIRTVGESKFGLGVGYERIFDDHGHNTIGLVGSFRPIHPLSFILSPGVSLEDDHFDEPKFALHAETSYEFEIGNLHIGPLLEVAYDPDDVHISLGLHLGIGF